MMKRWIAFLAAGAAALTLTACGEAKQDSVSVQSVAMICGFTTLTQSQQFAGIVSTGKEQNVPRDTDKKISVVYVKEGDQVKEGDKLFTYDSEQAKNSLERAKLELEEMQNSQASKEKEKAQLEKDKTKAAQSEQLDYTLKIQEVETDIRENNYNMALKEKEIQRLEDSMKNLDVTAPLTGLVLKAGTADASTADGTAFGENDDMDTGYFDDTGEGNDAASFVKIIENENYRIKGSINEQNVNDIYTGMDMVIYSRVDPEQTWRGSVTSVDLKNVEKNQDEYGYMDGGDEMTTSSKYPFYVDIDSLDGLMIGQHVYMRADNGEEDAEEIRLDASFINDAESSPWIWAESESGLLEKRTVTIEEFDEGNNTWLVAEGLTGDDYIAPSSGIYEEGMPCIENNNTAFDASQNTGGEDADGEYADDEYVDDEFADDGYVDDEYMDDEFVDDEFDAEYDEEFDEDFEDDRGFYEEEIGLGFGNAQFGGAVG